MIFRFAELALQLVPLKKSDNLRAGTPNVSQEHKNRTDRLNADLLEGDKKRNNKSLLNQQPVHSGNTLLRQN